MSRFDVVVVGGGPAGATTAWALATRGLRVAVLERSRFPREKVCGDFVEPRGLKLLADIGCLSRIDAAPRLPITHVAMYLAGERAYEGRIPFYGGASHLPPHGYIVPRDELDTEVLNAARRAGAIVHEDCAATSVARDKGGVIVAARERGASRTFRARIVVGADGAHSIVARDAGLLREDPRHVAVSQRGYVDGVDLPRGEAAFFFDRDMFPGYGWMFPMSGGRANVGVGILSEARARWNLAVPVLFQHFVEKLRRQHPGCRRARLAGRPLGGIVRTYGSAGPNHFDRGVLVGDAGCFVDPMTGEGITPAMESALLATPAIAGLLDGARAGDASLSSYETAFRAYFDPSMHYLDYCAAVMRNRHMRDFWIAVVARGCRQAKDDPSFARAAGTGFGGLDVRPLDILTAMWAKLVEDSGRETVRFWTDLASGRAPSPHAWLQPAGAFLDGWWRSILDDPAWHAGWTSDVFEKWRRVVDGLSRATDPRWSGPPVGFDDEHPGGAAVRSRAPGYSARAR